MLLVHREPMTSYVAFIRAINVGGRAVVRMTDVRDAFVRAGCERVRTCIQSGNVLFESSGSDVGAQCGRVCARITELTGTKTGMSVRFTNSRGDNTRRHPQDRLIVL